MNQKAENGDILCLCRELGEKFSIRASQYDKDGSFPVENFDDLKDAGLLGIMVPKEFGGLNVDFLTYTKALEQLAKGDAATGLTFNMHNIALGTLAEVDLTAADDRGSAARKSFCEWVFNEAVEGQKIFASASSEPGVGAHFSKLSTTYKRVDGGFLINGVKSFVSMAGYADYYVVAARLADSKSKVPSISFLVVEHDNPGMQMVDTWDTLGMRATSTNPVYFTDCFVPEDRLFLGSEGMALYKIAREPHWLVGGYNGVYLGISSAAFQFMVDLVLRKKVPGTEAYLENDSRVQHQVGELYTALESARIVTYHAARLVDECRGSPEANKAIHHAKYAVSELAPWLSSQAIRLCGAASLDKRLPLEKYYRDARCGGLMPATSDECLLYLGQAAFGHDLSKPANVYW